MNKKILTLISYFKNPLLDLNLGMGQYDEKDFTIYIVECGPHKNGNNEGKVFFCNKTKRRIFSIPCEENILIRIRKAGIIPFEAILNIKKDCYYMPVLIKDKIYSRSKTCLRKNK